MRNLTFILISQNGQQISVGVPSSINPSCIDSNFLLQISDDAASEFSANPAHVAMKNTILEKLTYHSLLEKLVFKSLGIA